LALAWAERYQQEHPEVRISVTGGGSGTGLAALLSGTVDIANASRKIKPEEIKAAEENGIEPQEYIIARDAIAVIVHPDNPVNQLNLEQISKIYRGEINNWQELGGDNRPIVRLSRETNSGTHVYFLESVIRLGEKENKEIFSADTLLLPSSEGIIAEVSENPNAIGYDGLGYVTSTVKVLALSMDPAGPYVMPSVETVNNGSYPVSRDLYMYTGKNLPVATQAYLDWIMGTEAQEIVSELGFVPIIHPITTK
jgi:phosphate transport system substrate-binding protein